MKKTRILFTALSLMLTLLILSSCGGSMMTVVLRDSGEKNELGGFRLVSDEDPRYAFPLRNKECRIRASDRGPQQRFLLRRAGHEGGDPRLLRLRYEPIRRDMK